jgi:xanthosine utilization system XapX-like protein
MLIALTAGIVMGLVSSFVSQKASAAPVHATTTVHVQSTSQQIR